MLFSIKISSNQRSLDLVNLASISNYVHWISIRYGVNKIHTYVRLWNWKHNLEWILNGIWNKEKWNYPSWNQVFNNLCSATLKSLIWRNFFQFLMISQCGEMKTLPSHRVEKREILSHQKIFRQINSLVSYLVKPLIPRNFCHKCVRENSRNFHTVEFLQSWFHGNFFLRDRIFQPFSTL